MDGPPRRLRSYVDLIAPDDVVEDEIQRALHHLHGQIASGASQHPPWAHVCGRVRVEFEIEAALANVWGAELHWLADEARRVWSNPGYYTLLPRA